MRLLLDTQVAIWSVISEVRLSPLARALIEDQDNEVAVSTVSVWEIAIKYPLLKRRDAPPFSASVAIAAFRAARFNLIDITPENAAAIESLPPMHADPFDRLILAQSISESMRLLASDHTLAAVHSSVIRA